jgi:hypothetical protein
VRDEVGGLLHLGPERVLGSEQHQQVRRAQLEEHARDLAGQVGPQRVHLKVEPLAQLLLVRRQVVVAAARRRQLLQVGVGVVARRIKGASVRRQRAPHFATPRVCSRTGQRVAPAALTRPQPVQHVVLRILGAHLKVESDRAEYIFTLFKVILKRIDTFGVFKTPLTSYRSGKLNFNSWYRVNFEKNLI